MAHVRGFGCVACVVLGRKQRSQTQADHIRSRGAGGKEAANLWALCASHHDERHRRGLRQFEYTYNLDAKAWGRFFEDQYTLHVFRQGGIDV
jgi:hypothetical protein